MRACSYCHGYGNDPQAPMRETDTGSFLMLVRPCPACGGEGVIRDHMQAVRLSRTPTAEFSATV